MFIRWPSTNGDVLTEIFVENIQLVITEPKELERPQKSDMFPLSDQFGPSFFQCKGANPNKNQGTFSSRKKF